MDNKVIRNIHGFQVIDGWAISSAPETIIMFTIIKEILIHETNHISLHVLILLDIMLFTYCAKNHVSIKAYIILLI